MNFNQLREEAKSLGIHYVGLTTDKLESRINDKKNNTGIYANSLIDPDAKVDDLILQAEKLNINFYYPAMYQHQLVEAINKALRKGVKEREVIDPATLIDNDLKNFFKAMSAIGQNERNSYERYKAEQARHELVKRKLEVPNI